MDKWIAGLVVGVGAIALIVAVALCCALPLMWCWNYVMPHVFGLPQIGLLQAFCLSFVSGVLVKSGSSSSK